MPTIDIDRESAREAAERELAKPSYPRPSLRQQFDELVEELMHRLLVKTTAVPGGWFTILVLLIGVAVAAVAAIRIARRSTRTEHADQPLFGPAELSAAQHRRAATRCAEAGDWAEAIRHRLRAVARQLEHAGVLHPDPGRTANELARAAAAALPDLATEFGSAAQTFNDVSYGELPATRSGYTGITELDERLLAVARPARSR